MKCKDVIRLKEEPIDTTTNAADEYVPDLVDSCKAENFETSPYHELSENLKVFIDFECKDFKPELTSLPTIICKSEDQSFQPIMKQENENPIAYTNKKSLIILVKKGFKYDNNCGFHLNSYLKLANYQKLKNCEETDGKNSLYISKIRLQTHKTRTSLEKHPKKILGRIKTHECNICHKSFARKDTCTTHISTVHTFNKSFECDSCHKSFTNMLFCDIY
ncbi:hypothetical protein TKK_0018880 [Trichogramma kaykai]